MTMTTTAAVLRTLAAPAPYAQSQPISIEEVTLEGPRPQEVLVKVIGAGLCHSDLSVINGSLGRAIPIVLGHEGAGEVLEVGDGVTDVKVGDNVVFQFSPSCGRCRRCLSGNPQLCDRAAEARFKGELIGGGTRFRDASGEPLRHMTGVSCFAQHVVVDRGSVVVVTPDLSLTEAALFGCAVMTGTGAVMNTAKVRPGEKVAVFGLGGVGLCGIMGAKMCGAEIIVGVDLADAKLRKAEQLGATHTFNARDNALVEKIVELTGGGVDVAFELAGAIPAMTAAYAVTARGGKVVAAGLAPRGSQFSFEQTDLVYGEKSVCGSFMGSCVPVRDIPRFITMYQSGQLPVDQLIDGVVTFDELNEGFDRLDTGGALRQVLAPHGVAKLEAASTGINLEEPAMARSPDR
ncbi:zinc-binding dehydrogenase [Acuticoccus sp.]|uniref:zinc-binding dehydrogenase n=1 Tax=Acuticoccus sp. TaxID=1904378 RepID=UPI003B523314